MRTTEQDQIGREIGAPNRTPTRAVRARRGLARWGRTALAGLSPAAWVLGAPIDIRAVARWPEPFTPDGGSEEPVRTPV